MLNRRGHTNLPGGFKKKPADMTAIIACKTEGQCLRIQSFVKARAKMGEHAPTFNTAKGGDT
jgi:hypothetical protein